MTPPFEIDSIQCVTNKSPRGYVQSIFSDGLNEIEGFGSLIKPVLEKFSCPFMGQALPTNACQGYLTNGDCVNK